jgi:hypothetical protein
MIAVDQRRGKSKSARLKERGFERPTSSALTATTTLMVVFVMEQSAAGS